MKQRIRLSESDLHRMIKESVRQVINEGNKRYDLGYKNGMRLAQTRIQRYGVEDGMLEIAKIISDYDKIQYEHIEFYGRSDAYINGESDALLDFYLELMEKNSKHISQ